MSITTEIEEYECDNLYFEYYFKYEYSKNLSEYSVKLYIDEIGENKYISKGYIIMDETKTIDIYIEEKYREKGFEKRMLDLLQIQIVIPK